MKRNREGAISRRCTRPPRRIHRAGQLRRLDALLEDDPRIRRGAFTDKARRAGPLSQAEHGTVPRRGDSHAARPGRAAAPQAPTARSAAIRAAAGPLRGRHQHLAVTGARGRFRSDLLSSLRVSDHLPPLRRSRDILLPARHFRRNIRTAVPVQLAATRARCSHFSWPGNARTGKRHPAIAAMTAAPVIVAADLGSPSCAGPSALLPRPVRRAGRGGRHVSPPAPAGARRRDAQVPVQRGEARGARRVRARLPSAGVARITAASRGSIRAQRAPTSAV